MTIYQTMFTRRSIRQYDKTALSGEELQKISDYLGSLTALEGAKCQFKIVNSDDVKNNQAPHYILGYSVDELTSHVNMGYILEKMDLYLQDNGYGSLWLGTSKPDDKSDLIFGGVSYPYCIMLAFGKTSIAKREGEKDFSRKPLAEISNQSDEIAAAMRLAPSAMNSQPWKFNFEKDKITINFSLKHILKPVLKRKLSKIDLGIATCFCEYALLEHGKKIKSITASGNANDYKVEVSFI